MRLVVVTRVGEGGGNLALALDVVLEVEQMSEANEWKGRTASIVETLGPGVALAMRRPVFRVGEVLVLDEDGRDQLGRDPGKWDVDVEEILLDVDTMALIARSVPRA